MKKLMIAAAIVCAAVIAQAASVSWGNSASSKIYGLDGTTAITAANAATWSLTAALVDKNGDVVHTAGGVSSMTAGTLIGTAWTYAYGTDASNGDAFSILLKMTVDSQSYEMNISDPGWTIAALNNTGTDSFSWAAGNYGGLSTDASVAGKWHSVPEPTSGLMLLLGVGLMALRRRRA